MTFRDFLFGACNQLILCLHFFLISSVTISRNLFLDLKQDVIQLIKDQHGTTSISPVLEEVDSPLLDFYVPPTVTSGNAGPIKATSGQSASSVQSVKDIFYGQNERHREIYLCADAGLGKTVFGKRLALIWCQANETEQKECNFTEEEEQIMKGFDFVFYISLKEADPVHIDVDDMVQQQIIKNLARASSYRTEFIEKVLTQQTCLIVLDGLDEWSHPKEHIPFRKPRQNCAFFTTTRPWKFTVARIRQSKIDQQLEMKGIDFAGKQKLMSNLLKATFGEEAESESEMQLKGFDEAVNKRNITGFETSPMLLLYLMCLWLDEKPMGDSRCGLYCNIVELLLQKLLDRHQIPAARSMTKDLPDCFKENEFCLRYSSYIKDLSHLAFITLFNKDIENKFVFSDKLTKKTMSMDCLEFWLKAGILTQIKGQRSLTSRESRVHFIHKTFHEFFAAVHLALTDQDTADGDVVKACSDLNSVLQYSNFLTFLCGLNPTVSSKVLNGVVATLSKDVLSERLRNNTYSFVDYWEVCDLKQKFQNLMVACVNECRDNGFEPRYQLDDVMLTFDGDIDNKYINALCDLTKQKNMKSVKFGGTLSTPEVHEFVENLEMRDMRLLEKLELWGHPGTQDVEVLLRASLKSLKCLLIHGGINNDIKYIEISEESFKTLEALPNIRCIDLFCITLKHDLIKKLFDWLERKQDMTQIKIARVKCSDHPEDDCMTGDFVFDLSGHANLKIIGLGNIFASGVKVNSSALEEFWADSNEPIISSFLTNYISSAANLHTFVVEFIHSKDTVDQIIGTLPKLDNLCHLQLKDMDLRDLDLVLTNQHSVKHVRLIELTLESRALKNLIDELGRYRHAVTMEIASCNVKHTAGDGGVSFEDLRQMIEQATDKFTVLSNLKCSGHDAAFAFRTIPSK